MAVPVAPSRTRMRSERALSRTAMRAARRWELSSVVMKGSWIEDPRDGLHIASKRRPRKIARSVGTKLSGDSSLGRLGASRHLSFRRSWHLSTCEVRRSAPAVFGPNPSTGLDEQSPQRSEAPVYLMFGCAMKASSAKLVVWAASPESRCHVLARGVLVPRRSWVADGTTNGSMLHYVRLVCQTLSMHRAGTEGLSDRFPHKTACASVPLSKGSRVAPTCGPTVAPAPLYLLLPWRAAGSGTTTPSAKQDDRRSRLWLRGLLGGSQPEHPSQGAAQAWYHHAETQPLDGGAVSSGA